MNEHEKSALQNFLQEMNQVRLERKDVEADALIRQAAQQQPDALYLLVQRALLQEQAMLGMQQQVSQLQQQVRDLQQPAQDRPAAGGFLDSASQWGRSGNASASSAPSYQTSVAQAAPASVGQPAPASMAQPIPEARPGLLGGGGGSFLGSMAGVVAGAAAGHFLYQGIEHMMHKNDNQAGAQNLGDMQSSQAGALAPDNALSRDAGVNDVGSASHRELAQWEDPDAGQAGWSDGADGGDFTGGDDTA